MTSSVPRRALVLGATGQIGHFLLPHLLQQGWCVDAVSRQAAPDLKGVNWYRWDLYHAGDVPQRPDVVFSAGPLDGLLAWLRRTRHHPDRIIAFSSTSVVTKVASDDPEERALAEGLLQSEQALIAYCDARGIGWTILRPTLIYGCGKDANITRIAALAEKWGWALLPRDATGLRQPVHAEDLAICAGQAANTDKSLAQRYDLPGSEQISYQEMVRRTVFALTPPRRVFVLPSWLFRVAIWCARKTRIVSGFNYSMQKRLRQDLVFSDQDAVRDLQWSPRPFRPVQAEIRPRW